MLGLCNMLGLCTESLFVCAHVYKRCVVVIKADWERLMVTTEGHAIPMTVAVGNHESSQESWGDQLAASKVTSYFDLFAQEEEEDRASNPRSRTTRQVHMVGPSLGMVVLDSRHVVTWESQVSWFEEQLAPNTPLSNAPIKPVFTYATPRVRRPLSSGGRWGVVFRSKGAYRHPPSVPSAVVTERERSPP